MITTCSRFVTTTGNKQCEHIVHDIGLTTTLLQLVTLSQRVYTRKNLASCSESANKPPTSRQQVVFAMLVPSCQQVWNKLLTTCNKLDDIIRLVARLFQQVRYSHDITILLQPCVANLVTFLLYHGCITLARTTL